MQTGPPMKNNDAEASELHRRKNELAGAVILKAIDAVPTGQVAGIVYELLDSGLKSAADRALFGLPPRGKQDGGDAPEGGSPPAAPPIEPERRKAEKPPRDEPTRAVAA
jgi:hypothetical protein